MAKKSGKSEDQDFGEDGPYMPDAERDRGEAVDRLRKVIEQAKHQANHNAPASPDMIRELEAVLALLG